MKKIMRALVLIFLLILLALPAIYTNSVFGYLPIVAVLILSLLSAIYLLVMKKSIVVLTNQENAQANRGEKVTVELKVQNKSFLMCGKAKAEIFVSDYFGNDDSVTKAVFTLYSHNTTGFSFEVLMAHVGVYSMGIRDINVYGLLGIFCIRIPVETTFTVTVLPQKNEMTVSLSDNMLTDTLDATSYSENDGFDYTNVREYAIGDSMKKIHWKLSAHSSCYMTKVNEVGMKSDMAVIIDCDARNNSFEELLYIEDGIIETAVSLMLESEKMDIDHRLLYIDKGNHISVLEPRSESDYVELIQKMQPLSKEKERTFLTADDVVTEELQSANRSANLIVCTSNITDRLLQSLIIAKQQQVNSMLYYIVKPNVNKKEMKLENIKIRMLDEYDIYYEIIVSDSYHSKG